MELGLGLGLGLGHLEFRCGETAEWVAWHQATHLGLGLGMGLEG